MKRFVFPAFKGIYSIIDEIDKYLFELNRHTCYFRQGWWNINGKCDIFKF